jgi:hypothetical protein
MAQRVLALAVALIARTVVAARRLVVQRSFSTVDSTLAARGRLVFTLAGGTLFVTLETSGKCQKHCFF